MGVSPIFEGPPPAAGVVGRRTEAISPVTNVQLPLTRSSALERLSEFAPHAGATYSSRRNQVDASGDHRWVSRLSAALRRRLVSEREIVEAVVAIHGYRACETFIAEVFWRTYWKGWLEHHPDVWTETLRATDLMKSRMEGSDAEAYSAASAGRTGIEAFDHWARELSETGYLHNWARMQVASIWVFTLGLPWELGADWMFRRLVDADPASNTLSWRWVRGLHTAGKTYLANADRIAIMTGGKLRAEGLATVASRPESIARADRMPLRAFLPPNRQKPTIVLLTPEDLSLEVDLHFADVRAVALPRLLAGSAADRIAMEDALFRAASRWDCPATEIDRLEMLRALARDHGAEQVVTGYVPLGPVSRALGQLPSLLAEDGLALTEHIRTWDRLAWPHCTKGFFQLRSRIPHLLADQGMALDGAVKSGNEEAGAPYAAP